MSNSIVREALLTSVTCTWPPVSFHSSQVSMVPKASSPCAAATCAPGTWSSSQRILVPEKYGSMTRPVLRCTGSVRPAARSCAHSGSVRRSCQTMALAIGWPVRRSHSTVVSRWLVMPMAAMSLALSWALNSASSATACCVAQISLASCSTQPGCGKICRNSRCAMATMRPLAWKTMARELEVPWSRASRCSLVVMALVFAVERRCAALCRRRGTGRTDVHYATESPNPRCRHGTAPAPEQAWS